MLESFENTEARTGTVGLTEQDSILITYGDALQRENSAPLQVLKGFLVANVGEVISAIHLLPFFHIPQMMVFL